MIAVLESFAVFIVRATMIQRSEAAYPSTRKHRWRVGIEVLRIAYSAPLSSVHTVDGEAPLVAPSELVSLQLDDTYWRNMEITVQRLKGSSKITQPLSRLQGVHKRTKFPP
jgi:hypothetical protein